MTLSQLTEIHESTKHHKSVYKGCLTPAQRQLMADIYKYAKLRPVKPSGRKFDAIRKAWSNL